MNNGNCPTLPILHMTQGSILNTMNEKHENTTRSGLLVLYLKIYCVNSMSFNQNKQEIEHESSSCSDYLQRVTAQTGGISRILKYETETIVKLEYCSVMHRLHM